MGSQIDFNKTFGEPKILKNKKINLIKLQVHPDFIGVFGCIDELFSALNFDLNFLYESDPFLTLWKDSRQAGYFCVHDLARFYHFNQLHDPVDLKIYNYPSDLNLVQKLKYYVGDEFLKYLHRFPYHLKEINPKRLQAMINQYIPSECLLKLNKKYSFKPHKTLGLEVLTHELQFTEKQVDCQVKKQRKLHQSTLNQLERNSPIAKAMLNEPNFILSPDLIWTAT